MPVTVSDINVTSQSTPKRPLSEVTNNQPEKRAAIGEPNIVEVYLNSSLPGRTALKAGRKGTFDEGVRQKLCHEIIRAELGDDPEAKISEQRFVFLSNCIVAAFPGEVRATYYTCRIPKNGDKKVVQPKGILCDKYHNFLKYLRKHGMRGSIRSAHGTEDCDDPIDVSLLQRPDIEWLEKHSLSSQQTTSEKWKLTSEYRQNLLWNIVSRKSKSRATHDKLETYLKQFPCLEQQWGLKLILEDFARWFGSRCVDVVSEWVPLSDKLRRFLNVKEAATATGTDLRVVQAVARLFKQPIMVLPTKKGSGGPKVSWKPTTQESVNGLLMRVQSIADLEPAVQKAKENCERVGRTLQPFPAVVGRTEDLITESYVVVDHLRYRVESPLVAVDTCFKLYQELHCQYPAQSSYSWRFIQQALYRLKTEFDDPIPSVERSVSDFRKL
ncbi:UDP-N-acetylmuramoylalanine--D-glutamate ligase [Frankliniella fusca]|uniref:UDP-N-acetylmuramoylalanine--D-glutamate ligase n=1 Tax=Frankliniella fusca TaxID=407009 RepID=A0AAE1LT59_9NEOP|nr:UDP-N-acetylmuramoylalanine--D-glutamate ligase [Frankliniella fusca]